MLLFLATDMYISFKYFHDDPHPLSFLLLDVTQMLETDINEPLISRHQIAVTNKI